VKAQVDYWDSINLKEGSYAAASKIDGIKDFLSQLKDQRGNAELGMVQYCLSCI
jgi:hypothetical protein